MEQEAKMMLVDILVGSGVGLAAKKHWIAKYGSMKNVPKKSMIALLVAAFAVGASMEAVRQEIT